MRFKQYITESGFSVKTKKDETGHQHTAMVNVDGDGKTISTSENAPEHEHQIFQWLVQPAKGHVHNLEDII